jgi:hypothetical protein
VPNEKRKGREKIFSCIPFLPLFFLLLQHDLADAQVHFLLIVQRFEFRVSEKKKKRKNDSDAILPIRDNIANNNQTLQTEKKDEDKLR